MARTTMEKGARRGLKKDIKHDEFVDTTWRFIEQIEENPRPFLIGIGAVVLAAVAFAGFWTMSNARAKAASEKLSLGLAALNAPIDSATASTSDPYSPIYASLDEQSADAMQRLETASQSGGLAGSVSSYLYGISQLQAGKTDEAIATLEAASRNLAGDPSFSASSKIAYARALQAGGRDADALTVWQQLSEQNSGVPQDVVLLGLAQAREATGDVDGAKTAYQELADLNTQLSVNARTELTRLGE